MVRRYTLHKTALMAVLVLCIGSCRPDCDADCAEVKTAPQEFLDYWFFPYGSQWVYQLKDSVGIYDTTYTGAYESWVHTKTPECNDGFTPCQTVYQHVLRHSNKIYFPGKGNDLAAESYRCEYDAVDKKWYLFHSSRNAKLFSFSTFVIYPFSEGQSYLNDNYLCAVNDVFAWENKTFPLFKACNPTSEPYGTGIYFQELWFAQGIGLVKVSYNNGEVWELVDYEIAKT